MTPIPLITGRYQLGNDAGLFQDAMYVGFELKLPFTKTWHDTSAATITFNLYTHDVETWGDWLGHRVSINGIEIGRLKDPADTLGVNEVFSLAVPRTVLEAALGGKDRFVFSVELELQPSTPGMEDDFVLWRVESDGTFSARLGWK